MLLVHGTQAMKGGFKKTAAPEPPPATSRVFPSGSLLEPLRVHLMRHHVKEDVIRECEEIVLKTVVQRLQAKLDKHPKEMMQMLHMLRKMEVRGGEDGKKETGRQREDEMGWAGYLPSIEG